MRFYSRHNWDSSSIWLMLRSNHVQTINELRQPIQIGNTNTRDTRCTVKVIRYASSGKYESNIIHFYCYCTPILCACWTKQHFLCTSDSNTYCQTVYNALHHANDVFSFFFSSFACHKTKIVKLPVFCSHISHWCIGKKESGAHAVTCDMMMSSCRIKYLPYIGILHRSAKNGA